MITTGRFARSRVALNLPGALKNLGEEMAKFGVVIAIDRWQGLKHG